MVEARTKPGMIARLRQRLVISASARHLAVELVDRHGRGAADAARAITARGGLSPQERLVLTRALPMIADLLAAGTAPSPRPRHPSRGMTAAVRAD